MFCGIGKYNVTLIAPVSELGQCHKVVNIVWHLLNHFGNVTKITSPSNLCKLKNNTENGRYHSKFMLLF